MDKITNKLTKHSWNFDAVMVPGLGEDEVEAASPGFGSAANSFMDFVNVNEGFPIFSIAGNLHRSKDPGAGAFTYYHSRLATAKEDISAGQEFFVSYSTCSSCCVIVKEVVPCAALLRECVIPHCSAVSQFTRVKT